MYHQASVTDDHKTARPKGSNVLCCGNYYFGTVDNTYALLLRNGLVRNSQFGSNTNTYTDTSENHTVVK
jgi:hypothetical protein